MGIYLVTGPNGAGKSTAGEKLTRRGYQVIETDSEPGFSSWVHVVSGERVEAMPSYPVKQRWLDQHKWLWDRKPFVELITKIPPNRPVFFCGNAHNAVDFYDLFSLRFGLFTDNVTTVSRLRKRGPERWQCGTPELQSVLAGNPLAKAASIDSGMVIIDSTQPVEAIVDIIVSRVELHELIGSTG